MKTLRKRYCILCLILIFCINKSYTQDFPSDTPFDKVSESFEGYTFNSVYGKSNNSLALLNLEETPSYCSITKFKCNSGISMSHFSIRSSTGVVFSENGTCNTNTGHTVVTSDTITLVNGLSYKLSFNIPGLLGNGEVPEFTAGKAWIDFNGNGSFDAEEKVMDMEAWARNSYSSIWFTIPNTTYQGLVRLRVIIRFSFVSENACVDETTFGEVRDYIIRLDDNSYVRCSTPPVVDDIPFKCNFLGEKYTLNAKGCSGTVKWYNKAVGGTLLYSGSSFETPVLFEPTDYYLSCQHASCESPRKKFSINMSQNPEDCYCSAVPIGGCDDSNKGSISQVKLTQNSNILLNNISGCSTNAYKYYTTPETSLEIGETYQLFVSHDSQWSFGFGVVAWIDFNGNGEFEEDEIIFSKFLQSYWESDTQTFTVPANSVSTTVRMRVRSGQGGLPNFACSELPAYGEIEDYIINLVGDNKPPCPNLITLSHPSDNIISGTHIIEANKTSGSINAENKIFGTNTRVSYEAATVTLSPPFLAEPGVVFTAKPGGCE